jgi:hypothetical protein
MNKAQASDQLPFEFDEPADWAIQVGAFKQQRVDQGGSVVLSGRCPRCKHAMEVLLLIKDYADITVNAAEDNQSLAEPFEKTAFCNCLSDHTGRPELIPDGCGAFGHLDIG